MRTMFKKAVASILALMLLVASLPISASAAATDKVDIDLSVVSLTDEVITAIEGGYFQDYVAEDAGLVDKTNTDLANLPGYADAINGMVGAVEGSGTAEDPYIIEKGQKFFVAVDMELTSATVTDGVAQQGIANNSSIRMDYPGGAFGYDSIVTSYINNPGLRGRIATSETAMWDYYPGSTGFEFTASETKNIQTTTPGTGSILINAANGSGFLAKNAAWDFLVRLSADKVGTHKIEIEKYDSTTQIENCASSAMSLGSLNYKRARSTGNATGGKHVAEEL